MDNDYEFAPYVTSSLLTEENISAHCHIYSLTAYSERFFLSSRKKISL